MLDYDDDNTLVQVKERHGKHSIYFKHGVVRIVDDDPEPQVQKEKVLDKPIQFSILVVDPHNQKDESSFKAKSFERQSLAEMNALFEDIYNVRNDGS